MEEQLRELYRKAACAACGARPGEKCRNALRPDVPYSTYVHVCRRALVDEAWGLGYAAGERAKRVAA